MESNMSKNLKITEIIITNSLIFIITNIYMKLNYIYLSYLNCLTIDKRI